MAKRLTPKTVAEVRAIFGAPRRMAASTALNTILRDARKSALLRMTAEVASHAQERGEGEELLGLSHALLQPTPESMLSRNSFTLETVPVSVAT
jgi:hypothetical protein